MTAKNSKRQGGSFRDPAGFVFDRGGRLYRQVNLAAKDDYDKLLSSGLYNQLTERGLLVPHKEVGPLRRFNHDSRRYKVIEPEPVPFISYPYEWTFSQLKAAALLTLEIQKKALEKRMILKDASAYNIQFIGQRPVFIDTLSFQIYRDGQPWEGYRQFCEHFITPLALAAYTTPELLKTLRVFLDGVPLTLATKLLPARARFKRGLLLHIFLHASSQRKYTGLEKKPSSAKKRRLSQTAMTGLLRSLEKTVNSLEPPQQTSQWSKYYEKTNYSSAAFEHKKTVVKQFLKQIKPAPRVVWDIGANDGTFSEFAAKLGAYTIAADVDVNAVEANFLKDRRANLRGLVLPLVQDLTNPTPPLGWAHSERLSLSERGPADAVLALALVHHLAIGNNLPFGDIAEFMSSVSRNLIIEFVPKNDSKVELLLAARKDIFADYNQANFEKAFSRHFKLEAKKSLRDSQRVIYLYTRKAKIIKN